MVFSTGAPIMDTVKLESVRIPTILWQAFADLAFLSDISAPELWVHALIRYADSKSGKLGSVMPAEDFTVLRRTIEDWNKGHPGVESKLSYQYPKEIGNLELANLPGNPQRLAVGDWWWFENEPGLPLMKMKILEATDYTVTVQKLNDTVNFTLNRDRRNVNGKFIEKTTGPSW